MNHEIHPDYLNCNISCSCGNSFVTRATTVKLKVDICGQCHPFYTGRQKFVDTAGRIQRFQEKYKWSGDVVQAASQKKKGGTAVDQDGDDDI